MASTIRDIAFQLRQGKLVALADETGWSIIADPINDGAVEQLVTLQTLMPTSVQPTVIIQNADQLVLYVAKIPDVAYDLVEFAEIPLTVVYEEGKNLSAVLWRTLAVVVGAGGVPTGEVAVRRALSQETQRLIGSLGRGLLSIPLEAISLPSAAEKLIADRFGTLPAMPKRPRIMRLAVNGEVNFIRK